MVNKTYGSVPKKTGTKISGRTEGDKRDEPDTATPWLVNNILFTNKQGMTARENRISYNTK